MTRNLTIPKMGGQNDWFEEKPATGDWDVGPFGMSGLVRGTTAPEDASVAWLDFRV